MGWMRRAAAALAVAAVVNVWHAPAFGSTPAPTVEILSPAAGAVVQGTVSVEVLATVDPALGFDRIAVELWPRRVLQDLPRTGCADGCRLTVVFDTVAPVGHPGSSTYIVGDGPTFVKADLVKAGTMPPSDVHDVVVNNHRPSVTVAPPLRGSVASHSADTELRINAYATPATGSTAAIRSMEIWRSVPWDQGQFTPPATAGGPWSVAIDTSAYPEGNRWEYIVALDERGVSSKPFYLSYMVSHGFTLEAPTLPDPVPDTDLYRVQLPYSYAKDLADTRPIKVTTYLDGTQVYEDVLCCGLLAHTGTLPGHIGMRVPPGQHVIGYEVTDSRDNVERVDVPVTVVPTMSTSWTAGAGGRVSAGAPLRMSASVRSTTERFWTWSVTVDGQPYTGAGTFWHCSDEVCPQELTASFDYVDLRPGTHTVELHVSPLHGFSQTLSTTVTVDAYLPPTPLIAPGNWTGQAGPDVLSRRAGGALWLQQAQHDGTLDHGWQIGSGWGSFAAILGPGDWDGDRRNDLLAVDSSGRLWLYPGNGTGGFRTKRQVGSGWGGFTALLTPGDWDGDRRNDLVARDSSGRLWLYPGNGTGGFRTKRQIGSGWDGFTALVTPGDWDGDRKADVLARDTAGRLWLYPGSGTGGFGTKRQVGSGWQTFNTIVGTADVNWDGTADVYARDGSGTLWLYPGNGKGGFGSRKVASRNWL